MLGVVAMVGPAAAADLRAGAARVQLTVPDGTPLAGYGSVTRRLLIPDVLGRHPHAFWFRPHQGQLDPLAVRALVLADARTRFAWITADLVAVDRTLTDEVTARLAHDGIASTVFLSASHTHSGPGAFVDSRVMAFLAVDREDPEVRASIVHAIAEAVRRADRAKVDARIGAATVQAPPVTTGRLDQPVDREIVAVKIASTRGAPIALLWNFAIHGTMLGPSNMALSADVMGAATHDLERSLGVPVLFVNGAVGDVSPRAHGRAAALSVGHDLAVATRDAFARADARDRPALATRAETVELGSPSLPLRNCLGRLVPSSLGLPLGGTFPRQARLVAGAAGHVAWVTIPGELQSRLGEAIKRSARERWPEAFVAGVSNDYLGYFVGAAEYERPSYPSCAALYGREAGERIARAAEDLLRGLAGAQR